MRQLTLKGDVERWKLSSQRNSVISVSATLYNPSTTAGWALEINVEFVCQCLKLYGRVERAGFHRQLQTLLGL